MGRKRFILLGAIAAALAFVFIMLKINPPGRETQEIIIRQGEPGDIRRLLIQNGFGEFEIRYTGEGYEVHDIPAPLVDYDRFMELMEFCATPRANKLAARPASGVNADKDMANGASDVAGVSMANDASDVAGIGMANGAGDGVGEEAGNGFGAYGLETPAATVSVQYVSGPDLTFYIGGFEPVSKSVYFNVAGNRSVYLMDTKIAADFLCPPKGYISLDVTESSAFTSPLSAVIDASFFGGGLERPVVIESVAYGGEELKRLALSYGAASHLVHLGDDTFELDQTYGIQVLGSLLGITAADIEAYNCTNDELFGMGILTPWLYIDFDLAVSNYGNADAGGDSVEYGGGADAGVDVGGGGSSGGVGGYEGNAFNLRLSVVPLGDGKYLVRRNAEDIVYITDKLAFMSIDEEKLMNRWYLSPMIMDLSGVSASVSGFDLNFELGGESNAGRTVKLNAENFDITVFRKFFRLLTSASNDGELLSDSDLNVDALVTVIEYRYLDPLKPPDRIEFYMGPGTRKLIAVVNGKPVKYGIRSMFYTRVTEACYAILDGKDFDADW